MNNDAEHLRLLSIFYYIYAALVAFSSLFALLYIFMGVMFAVMGATIPLESGAANGPRAQSNHEAHDDTQPSHDQQEGATTPQHPADVHSHDPFANPPPPPAFFAAFGLMFACIGAIAFLIGASYATALVFVGRSLARRTRRLFCLIMAGISCANMPLGLILGVFTFVVLLRPSVQMLFEEQARSDPMKPPKSNLPF